MSEKRTPVVLDWINGSLLLTAGVLLGSLLTRVVQERLNHDYSSCNATTPTLLAIQAWKQSLVALFLPSMNRHARGSHAYAIEEQIQSTFPPSRALGMRVHSFDEAHGAYLSLEAPLQRNTNVHGTAFAGSLFSVGCLTSFYLTRQWMQKQNLAQEYTLVARSANIRYRRPVRSSCIVSKSVLPSTDIMTDFGKELQTTGRASVHVTGTILQPDPHCAGVELVACEYSVDCYAYRPRTPSSS